VEAILAILAICLFAAAPIGAAFVFASIAVSTFRENGVQVNRWMVCSFFLIGFSLICYSVTLWTLQYTPEDKPGLLNPILVILMLESLCLLPIVFVIALRGLAVVRERKMEAWVDFTAVALYGFLYVPYAALHAYYPHV
jgi:hypothetical protein